MPGTSRAFSNLGAYDTVLYTLEEVSQHNTSNDCWIVVDGKVYDVSKFLVDHPGGDDVIIASTGKDATDDFENVGHSNSARAIMKEYVIGRADISTFPTKPSHTPVARQGAQTPDKTSELLIKILQFLVPLIILCFAVALGFYAKTE